MVCGGATLMSAGGGYNLSEYLQMEQERQATQPLATSCAFCDWSWEGTVGEGLKKARAHREKKHPETLKLKRNRSVRTLHSFRTRRMDADSKDEIDTERRRRAYVHGVEIEDG